MKTLAMTPTRFFPAGVPDPATQILAIMPGIARLPAVTLLADRLLLPDHLPMSPTRRLVVLVPSGEVDITGFARRVWQLAESCGFNILYLAPTPAAAQVAYQRRRLAELAAITTGKDIQARASLSSEKSWPGALENTLRPGDLLVCLSGHRSREFFLRPTLLGECLAETLAWPVYVLGGLKVATPRYRLRRFKDAGSWLASILMIALFFVFQLRIDRLGPKPASTVFICLTILLELYLLMRFNEWIG